MKKMSLLFAASIAAAVLGSTVASAQEKEKVITGTVSMLSPSNVQVLNEYISDQLYSGSGVFTGLNVRLGALYRKHDNLSWDLYYTGFNRASALEESRQLHSLTNPANSQYLKYSSYNAGYGTYYHWNIGKKLMIKAGGISLRMLDCCMINSKFCCSFSFCTIWIYPCVKFHVAFVAFINHPFKWVPSS